VDFEGTYFVATCGTCQGLLLYWTQGDPSDEGESGPQNYFQDAKLLWPEHVTSENVLPAAVAAIYAEATIVKRLSPNSFAVQIRRALEAICTERGVKSDSLYKMLSELARRGDLPPVLAEMTDVLRLLGNMGAHASDQPVKASQVDALDEFFRAVIEYIYIAPDRLRRFQKRLKVFDRGRTGNET
jgi:hypothetical protein